MGHDNILLDLFAFERLSLPDKLWKEVFPVESLEKLKDEGVLKKEELPTEAEEKIYDLGDGKKIYFFRKLSNTHFEAVADSDWQRKEILAEELIEFSLKKTDLLQALRLRNGMSPPAVDLQFGPDLIPIGETLISGQRFVWVTAANNRALSTISKLVCGKLLEAGTILLFTASNLLGLPRELVDLNGVVTFAWNDLVDSLTLDLTRFLLPKNKLYPADVAAYLWNHFSVKLFIAENTKEIFIFGVNLNLGRGAGPYICLRELARRASIELIKESFSRDILGHKNSCPLSEYNDDIGQVRKAIKAQIHDVELQRKAIALFKSSGTGKIKLPLQPREIFFWGENGSAHFLAR